MYPGSTSWLDLADLAEKIIKLANRLFEYKILNTVKK